jgi:1,4-alpha-glucan branching enzyme
LRYFIDTCHASGIGVLLDWVPAHFPRDEFALARFTGEACYEYGDPNKGEHHEWGTLIFNYNRNEVRNFLIASAVYWIEEFHIDGLRVDAVASMLYLDYSRKHGQWTPNMFGGREHLEAMDFLRNLNETVLGNYPGVLTLAEESTDWPMVSRPPSAGGLGFSMKWNMGWMHDTLSYMQSDPVYRRFHQNQLTFSQLYAYSENFVLPLSHDEVVHMKRSMLDKMPGDVWQKFANLRALYAYQYTHPGKKLLFMGGEFGQWNEWSESKPLDWVVSGMDKHAGLRNLVHDLNHLYRSNPALYAYDFSADGFQWISCDDTENSILVFVRRSLYEFVVCAFNFTPVPRENYLIGVPQPGAYVELLNTDAAWYGGTDLGNAGRVEARDSPHHGFDFSLRLTLPPLAGLILQRAAQ